MVEVHIPKETNGIYLGENTAAPKAEAEFLLGRGLNYKVHDKNENKIVLEVVSSIKP